MIMPTPLRIAICMPTYERWFEEFRRSFQEFFVDAACRTETHHLAIIEPQCKSALIHWVRETLFLTALAMRPRPDYILCLDTDMVIPVGLLDQLLSREKDIICGVFHRRGLPYDILAWKWTRPPTDEIPSGSPLMIPIEALDLGIEPIKVGACGFGCVLIKTSALDRIPKPWFMPDPTSPDRNFGEDVLFCKQCYKAGIEIYLDPLVKCGHVSDQHIIITHDNYLDLREGIYRVNS